MIAFAPNPPALSSAIRAPHMCFERGSTIGTLGSRAYGLPPKAERGTPD